MKILYSFTFIIFIHTNTHICKKSNPGVNLGWKKDGKPTFQIGTYYFCSVISFGVVSEFVFLD